MKVADLEGVALDWAVAKAMGLTPTLHLNPFGYWVLPNIDGSYSTEWALGGPIIEREGMLVGPSAGHRPVGVQWTALRMGVLEAETHRHKGPTPLIAAMRCYVASKMGDTIEVPEALTKE
jgi:hypothetical protein